MGIKDFLSIGRENALPLQDLACKANLSERAVQKEILESRLRGDLIISGDDGYFLPSGSEELREYVIRKKSAIRTSAAALRPFINALKEVKQ